MKARKTGCYWTGLVLGAILLCACESQPEFVDMSPETEQSDKPATATMPSEIPAPTSKSKSEETVSMTMEPGSVASSNRATTAPIRGRIFLREDGYHDRLGGTKLQLVRATELRPQFEQIVRDMVVRNLALRIRDLQNRKSENSRAKAEKLKLEKEKVDELAKCQRERWNTFYYRDPVNNELTELKYQIDINNTSDATLEFMRTRLAEFRKLIPKHDQTERSIDQEISQIMKRILEYDPAMTLAHGATGLNAVPAILRDVRDEKQVRTMTVKELIEAIDYHTEDVVTADIDGTFQFDKVPPGDYFVYANHKQYSWLVQVKYGREDGLPRKAVLSTQNTINFEQELARQRADNMQHSLDALVTSLGFIP